MEIFGLFLVCLVIMLTQSVITNGNKMEDHKSRRRRYGSFRMQHPAYSMMSGTPMSFPGHTMHSGMSSAQQECITDDIVCPSWCLMEDEWGCKQCPCGPANGMSPAIMSEHEPAPRQEDTHDCIGTILCMLSCKNGYKLGEPSHHGGCQSCTCVKKSETSGHDASSNHRLNSTQSGGKHCQWPLCMNGATPNNGPGSGSGMTSLPMGEIGSSMGAGGSLPGVDCMGPTCSAKNGMHITPHGPSIRPPNPVTPQIPMISSTTQPQHHVTLCPRTEICINSCKYHVELGPVDPDGCKMCRCIIPPTIAPSRLLPLIPTPVPLRSCGTLEHCINTCIHGFEVERSRQYCPECKCINPTTPSPATSKKPDIMTVLKVCPDTVHCMKSCTQGYTLTSQSKGCPKCICNNEPKVVLLCEQSLSCPYGCTVGYKCDTSGCPTCNCITPSETKLLIKVQTTTIDAVLTCSPMFSCADKCVLGYKTGDNGCPTCVCLPPISYMDKKDTMDKTLLEYGHRMEVLPQNNILLPVPDLMKVSGIGCFDSSCQSLHEIGNGNNMFISATEHNHNIPQTMNSSGHALLVDRIVNPDSQRPYIHTEQGCSGPACSAPVSHVAKGTPAPGECLAILHCVMTCTGGYDISVVVGADGCPTCTCVK